MKYSNSLRRFIPLVALLVGLTGCKPKQETAAASAAPVEPAVEQVAMKKLPTLPIIDVAPEWTLNDLEGNPVSSDQFKGKVVVVDFWATWCPPCREEIPGYIELQKKYGPDGLVIIGVSLDRGGPDKVVAFAKKFGINYPLVMGDNDTVAAFGGFSAIPTTFLIDRDGNIRDVKTGSLPMEVYEKTILSVLK